MSEATVLDLLLGVLLVGYLIAGLRSGLLGSAAAIAGVLGGLVAAWLLAPQVAAWIPYPVIRPIASVMVALALVALGNTLGVIVGRQLRRGLDRSPIGWLDRLLGGVLSLGIAALVASVLAASVAPLGVPLVSRAIAGSTVLRTIGTLTPDPVEAWLAQVRGFVVEQGIPTLSGLLTGPRPEIPRLDAGSPALTAAAQSVVRITGNAYACGVAQSGSGFVIADDRVVTNAHVVAGVTEPVVEAPDGQVVAGTVVAFDADLDLAVIAVPGLTAPALPLADTVGAGTDTVVQGYPFGGPFTSVPAAVVSVVTAPVNNFSSAGTTDREVYTLAAEVREGNSGGPLLALDGSVVGIVFARDGDDPQVGYAMTMAELDPVAAAAPALSQPVSSGACVG